MYDTGFKVSMFFKNNKSALDNSEFVDQAVSELVYSGCVQNIPFIPYVVDPLSVATNKSGKKRLILDLSVLNKFVKKHKFKFEDWKLVIQFFKEDSYLYKVGLSSFRHLPTTTDISRLFLEWEIFLFHSFSFWPFVKSLFIY